MKSFERIQRRKEPCRDPIYIKAGGLRVDGNRELPDTRPSFLPLSRHDEGNKSKVQPLQWGFPTTKAGVLRASYAFRMKLGSKFSLTPPRLHTPTRTPRKRQHVTRPSFAKLAFNPPRLILPFLNSLCTSCITITICFTYFTFRETDFDILHHCT